MNRFATVVAAVALALTAGFAAAQMSQGGPQRHESGGPDRAKMREAYMAAHEACKGKPDQRACMTEQICSKASDPKRCFEHAKKRGEHMAKRMEERQKMHEACNGKRGPELDTCLQTLRKQKHAQHQELRQKAHEACNGKRGEDLGRCLHEQREKLGLGGHHRGGHGHHRRG